MKVLESRRAPEKIIAMSWSPKMDLVALMTAKFEILVHRLTWQKVWTKKFKCKKTHGKRPRNIFLSWHPEGIFLAVGIGQVRYVLEPDTGKIIGSSKLQSFITFMCWEDTKYENHAALILKVENEQHSGAMKSHVKPHKMENCLTLLYCGTRDGKLHGFIGGMVPAFAYQLNKKGLINSIVYLSPSKDLSRIYVLTRHTSREDNSNKLRLNVLSNDFLPQVAPLLNQIAIKYIMTSKTQQVVFSELNSVSNQWKRLHDIYHAFFKSEKMKKGDARRYYMEFMLTGVLPPELEHQYGSSSRAKDVKKQITLVSSIVTGICDSSKVIRNSIVPIFMNLSDVGGFMYRISRTSKMPFQTVKKLLRIFSSIYITSIVIPCFVKHFQDTCLHFWHLLLNVITTSISSERDEAGDIPEEEVDVDKVIRYLALDLDKDIFKYIRKKISIGSLNDKLLKKLLEKENLEQIVPMSFDHRDFAVNCLNIPRVKDMFYFKHRSFADLPQVFHQACLDARKEYVDKGIQKEMTFNMDMLLPFDWKECNFLHNGILGSIKKSNKLLMTTPILSSAHFSKKCWNIIQCDRVVKGATTKCNPITACLNERGNLSIAVIWGLNEILIVDVKASSHKLESRFITCKIMCHLRDIKFSGPDSLCIAGSKVKNPNEENPKTLVMMCPVQELFNKSKATVSHNIDGQARSLPPASGLITIDIPSDSMMTNKFAEDFLAVNNFNPLRLAVSRRKTGCVLSSCKKMILLLDMDSDATDSFEDDCDGGSSDSLASTDEL